MPSTRSTSNFFQQFTNESDKAFRTIASRIQTSKRVKKLNRSPIERISKTNNSTLAYQHSPVPLSKQNAQYSRIKNQAKIMQSNMSIKVHKTEVQSNESEVKFRESSGSHKIKVNIDEPQSLISPHLALTQHVLTGTSVAGLH